MARICNLTELQPSRPVVLTIGVFDGVHRGHQTLIGEVRDRARLLQALSVALTFDPHPRAVLVPDTPVQVLTSTSERLQLIADAGVDVVALLPFTHELSRLSADAFMDVVQRHLRLCELVVGPDFALGYRRSGTVEVLRALGERRGFVVRTVLPLHIGGVRVSSSRVRELVATGDVEQATELLGRFPRLEGTVVRGAQRGRLLGFPTANLALSANYLLPANGIYAVHAELEGRRLPAVCNVGVRPTFGTNERLVEVYILDFSSDIYGRRLGVQFIRRIRDEERFATIEDLIARMHQDVVVARGVFADAQAVSRAGPA